jgi:hypothetical protein
MYIKIEKNLPLLYYWIQIILLKQIMEEGYFQKRYKIKIKIKYHFTFSDIEVQFDNNAIGIIIVVKSIKYIDIPSIPR